ncbi:MAG: 50S ribosomal protein L21, partial [Proteobacteria bacterium]|nr:50S ribosomal protein L21 [Pseudomonadota bacterium]
YKVAKDDVITVEKIPGEAGQTVELDEVLMIGEGAAAAVGDPLVAGAKVMAKVLEQTRADKILVFKKKRRKKYRRTQGHRQDITVLRVTDLLTAGAKPAKAAPKEKAAPKAEPKAKAKVESKAKAAPKKAPAKKAPAKKAPAKAKKTAAADKSSEETT